MQDKHLLLKKFNNLEERKNNDIIKINQLYEDERNNISRFPISNQNVITNTLKTLIHRYISTFLLNSSLYTAYDEFKIQYMEFVNYYDYIEFNNVGYINMLWIISLGILFDVDKDKICILMNKIDENEVDDVIYDFLFDSIGLKRMIKSKKIYWKKPYENLYNIILAAFEDKNKASELLVEYVDKQWFKGHSAIGWKEDSIANQYGLWSYDAAVVSKIFSLDDGALKNHNHYPYILVHDGPKLNNQFTSPVVNHNTVHEDNYLLKHTEFISILPNSLHRVFDEILQDKNDLDYKSFWEKYNLNEVWYSLEDFEEDKDTSLGEIIVNILVDHEYILQLDYKEVDAEDADFGDIISWIPELWDCDNYKVIRFELDNDQYYFAKIPVENEICDLYEVKVSEVKM